MNIVFALLLLVHLLSPMTNAVTVPKEEDWISITEAIELNNDGSTQKVRGYIVGYVKSQGNVSREDFTNDYNVALADNPGETDIEQMLFVQVTKDFRSEFGLASNPDNLDKEIFATGNMEKYHNHYGLKDPLAMAFVDEEEQELDLLTIAEAREQETGPVKVQGIVTAKLKNTIHIQDETGGIAVRPTSLDVQLGEKIIIQGSLQDYRSLLQVDRAELIEKKETPGIPEPVILSGSELTFENQSKLATIESVTIVDVYDGGTWANYDAVDEEGTAFIVRDENNELPLTVGTTFNSITGIVSHFDGEPQIIPRSNIDIIVDDTVVQSIYATPEAGVVPKGTEVTLSTHTPGATIYYTTDDKDPLKEGIEYKDPIVLEENTTIRAVGVKDDLAPSDISTFDYVVYDDHKGIQIHDIQGEGHISPMKGHFVTDIEGIVTYKYNIRGSHYFHIQAPEDKYDGNPKTSEAVVVYTGREEDVEVGDYVAITGKVDEYHIDGYDDRAETDLSVTQINARDDQGGKIDVIDKNVELPEPIVITSSDIPEEIISEEGFKDFDPQNYAIDFWESIEAMRVEIAPSKAVAPQEHGDVIVVTEEFGTNTIHGGILLTEDGPSSQTIQFKLHPNDKARDLAVKTGDKITKPITGVVNYGFSHYKVYADLADIENALVEGSTTPKSTKIVKDEDQLTVAAYNVENFSANTSDRETPKEKAENIARAFVEDMESPDIVGVVEVQDNNGQLEGPEDADASESYMRLIREIEEAGGPTYDYVNIDPEYNQDGGAPHGNIRVGFLYNPDRVSFVEAEHGTATEAVRYEDGQLTLNPGRIEPNHPALENTRKPLAAQFEFKGETVVVVANHFNSKLGDEPYFGQNQPPTFGSVEQRKEIAQLVNNFVKEVLADNPEENVIVLGDMNDFEFSEALQVLKGDELTNMIECVPEEERYTYIYQGNSQVLDHVLVTNNLKDRTEIDIIHVNADFTEQHGRASDHEPILAQIDLLKEESEEQEDPETSEDLEDPEKPEIPEETDTPDEEGAIEEDDGKDLPKTATNLYNFLFVGFILLIFGGIIFHAHRRHSM